MRHAIVLGLGLALSQICLFGAQAAEPQQASAGSTPSTVDLQRVAEDSCKTALDNEHFEWNTMDDCVTETVAKLKKRQQQHASTTH
jgi:hypothetical protein